MPTRITKAYEKIVIAEYLKGVSNLNVALITYPDPPDCLIEFNDGSSIWIEVSAVYRHDQLAKNLNSSAPGIVFIEDLVARHNFHNALLLRLLDRIKAKDSKPNYVNLAAQYGRGILILYIDDPLCSVQDIRFVIASTAYSEINCNNFHSTYLYTRPTYSDGESIKGLHKLI